MLSALICAFTNPNYDFKFYLHEFYSMWLMLRDTYVIHIWRGAYSYLNKHYNIKYVKVYILNVQHMYTICTSSQLNYLLTFLIYLCLPYKLFSEVRTHIYICSCNFLESYAMTKVSTKLIQQQLIQEKQIKCYIIKAHN